jgi:hypothetical protein
LKKPLAIWAGLALLGFGTVATAGAQTIYASPGYAGPGLSDPALPPYEIMSIVRSTGLAPLTRPMRRGPYYVLVAVDRVGRQMRVVVDAQLGDIVNLRPALAAGSYGPELGRPVGPPGTAAAPPDVAGANAAYGPRPGGELYGTHPSVPPHPAAENALSPPPRPVPNARTAPALGAPVSNATAPNVAAPNEPVPSTRVAVAEPGLPPAPPLPRPRPKLALNEAPAASVAVPVGSPAAKPAAAAAPAAPAATPSPGPGAAEEAAKSIE